MADRLHVALIDDDAAVLDSLRIYLNRNGVEVSCFDSADAYLAAPLPANQFDCIVADVRMPGMSGLDLMKHLATMRDAAPVILITGHGDVEMAVEAIKLGAFDFIEKPFDERRLLDSVGDAVGRKRREDDQSEQLAELARRAEGLSTRQREVMKLAGAGLSNKEIATRLGISPRTVEIHRAWMMERMGARNVAELVRMVMQLGDRL
jgi:two-component system response regulator FixJ